MYEPGELEIRQQQQWGAEDLFTCEPEGASDDAPRCFVFPVPPFPTGALHMGHVRSYVLADAYSRYRRVRGDVVLFAIGWDAFGLPAELAAIERGMPTEEWVSSCCALMDGQLKRLGLSLDDSRVYDTSDEDMYRWSQWLFLLMREKGLVYQETGWTDWCDHCGTALASMQVEDGKCWRCDTPATVVMRTQWYLKVTEYVEENERALEGDTTPKEPEWVKPQQTILGRVDGVDLTVRAGDGRELTVFTPHADDLAGAVCVLVSPRHPEIDAWIGEAASPELDALRKGRLERHERDVTKLPLIDTGQRVRVEGLDADLPVVVTPSVDTRFGETAILCIPDADRNDAVLADRLGLEPDPSADGQQMRAAARQSRRYRVRDFVISRQRRWGPPIPIVNCDACGAVSVPMSELPVTFTWDDHSTKCPGCGGPAAYESDTLDTHFDGLWWFMSNCVPPADRGGMMSTIQR